jgi:RHS repeat-associated protein
MYDSNGNLTTKTEGPDTWTHEWNARNELTRVTKNSVEQARFSYDPVGRRVEKVAGGVTTSYTYSGHDIVQELRGGTALKYINGLRTDEPLAVDDGSSLAYFHADGLGSVVKVTSAAGAVNFTRRYDAWGTIEAGATEPGYAFTGREWDPQTGLYYYRARYYEPKAGRFLGEDPLRFEVAPNFYAYVLNNPQNLTDPSGLEVRQCRRPVRGNEWADHQWLCVSRADGGWDCGGQHPDRNQTRSDWMSWWPTDGAAYPHRYGPKMCSSKVDPSSDSKCFDECVRRNVNSPRRPSFAIGPLGTDCQEWKDEVIAICVMECGKGTPSPAPPPGPSPR